ncbi:MULTISPECIES: hypothetical protein [unclassified Streptomyces]|uniref:hypothetical protein n=1 Tax=unclassified Streptomyces TaxID=2593676 RepID=UPI002DD89102|nr:MULTISPECIES: hypothetical protein [unclassified Streptomyces]WSA91494.1 hypothetical protein OIE63_07925 [Streptomyces sp. NBC_01795]WSB75866.1 hypothetical protein OHB04_08740 [Streptomyces sp. NBC_01775]WSS15859.1 hypothetical protein OG533_31200 [Streptomyces sp. NBC_01186]WSS44698.1 hypothetical protein OG220_31980 [Streptomyces sp. NBC_01187]
MAEGDTEAVFEARVRGWQHAYAELIPQAHPDAMHPAENTARRRRARRGRPRMLLWVPEGNARTRRFYEKAGFAHDGLADSLEVGGATVPEVRYVRSLADLEPAEV